MARSSPARDIAIAGAVVGSALLVLWLYTGVWPPMVVVESNSMMHTDVDAYKARLGSTRADDVGYGRLGTIDPGDLILVQDIDTMDDISLWVDQDEEHYHDWGDVIIYYTRVGPDGEGQGTPIIHRAMTHVDVDQTGDARSYTVRWTPAWDEPSGATCTRAAEYTCTFGEEGVTISELGMTRRRPQHSGLITQGDNPATNPSADQVSLQNIIDQPIRLEQVQGVARGELPWFGLIKLALTGTTVKNAEMSNHDDFFTFLNVAAPKDLWVMLVVSLGVLTLAPMAVDALLNLRAETDGERGSEFSVFEDDQR